MTANRFFIKAYGPDDDALKIALAWLAKEATRRQLPAVIVVYQSDQGRALARVIGEAQAKGLLAGTPVKLNGVDLSLVTMRKLGPMALSKKVALAVWLSDKDLAKVDDARPAAMGIVPWAEGDGEQWIESWNAIDMRSGQAATGGGEIDSPIVAEALRSLTGSVNLGTGLGHPSDRDLAIETFQRLHRAGERFDGRAVRVWAVQHGWSSGHADELAKIAEGVRQGKRFKRSTPGRVMLKDNIIEIWRERSKGGKP